MSFASDTKNELAHVQPEKKCCMLAEISGFLRVAGSIGPVSYTHLAVLHFPPTNEMHQASDFTKLFESYGVKKCIYGHLHGKDNFRRGMQGVRNGVSYSLVSLDYLDAKPKEVYTWEKK